MSLAPSLSRDIALCYILQVSLSLYMYIYLSIFDLVPLFSLLHSSDFYRLRVEDNMRQEVRGILQEYMPLEEMDSGGGQSA